MLTALEIRDILLIDRLDLAFQPGLNVLTGETGAGKSILLDALGLALGWKGRADLVRAGATQGEVTAVFDLVPDHPARTVLADAGIEAGDELILRRVTSLDGRRTAWANDRRVSAEVLRNLGATLVELQGQQDDGGLMNPRGHRALLDAFGAIETASLRTLWRDRARAAADLAAAEAAQSRARADEDWLRAAVAELDKLDPQPGEEAELDARRRAMQAVERIRADVSRAHAAVTESGAERQVADALRWLEGAADRAEGRLDAAIAALTRALVELGEAGSEIEMALRAMDVSPGELEAVEERLFAIRGLAKKHRVQPDDLGRFAIEKRLELEALDSGGTGIAALRRAVDAAEAAYSAEARRVSQARATAAKALDAAMAGELAPLKLDRARFETRMESAEPGPEGADAVTFTVATNPGAPAGPLNRIASGGELSRFLLALKVCLTRASNGLTLIFDEIDRGVGGATADAVGRRLQRLAEGGQILVVTHAPQVAARGAHHWRVEKRVEGEATLSRVVPLSDDQRVEELARMLAGDTVTTAAREAARALLQA
ncbi:DNA repair protein RecN [Neotabrizicola shimadae]|uniref:DNA repair protein RecN n=1 Tax=Neotabrizicola shimadae TaxID=2807096 RepID=A0A8G0ZTN2_9RHOB|nr:DNA repair protein RecN [Neotabrizicola shimadae]QYZ68483.1 DNA repair protein RecN [Neotabrizicola shimadae]